MLRKVFWQVCLLLLVSLALAQRAPPLATSDLTQAQLSYLQNALLCQRRLSFAVPLFRVLVPGMDTESILFNGTDYSTAKVTDLVTKALQLGIRRLVLTLYFDVYTQNLQFCPLSYGIEPYAESATDVVLQDPWDRSALYTCPSPQTSLATLLQPLYLWCQDNNDYNYRDVLVLVVNVKMARTNGTSAVASATLSSPFATDSSLTANTESSTSSAVGALSSVISLVNASMTASATVAPTTSTTATVTTLPTTVPLSDTATTLFGKMLYTPHALQSQRSNLNDSWLNLNSYKVTTTDYYSTNFAYYRVAEYSKDNSSTHVLTTPNGWPSLQYMLSMNTRVLVGFGSVDSSAALFYNFSADSAQIFAAENISGIPPLYLPALNFPTGSCSVPESGVSMESTGLDDFMPPESPLPSAREVSWGFAYVSSSPQYYAYNQSAKIINCGFQPLFSNRYSASLIESTVWSWAELEPVANENSRCAVMSAKNGRWYNTDCSVAYPVACKSYLNPLNWTIVSSTLYIYYEAGINIDSVCPEGFYFGVPMTPQENSALYAQLSEIDGAVVVWINYNSIGAAGCWVFGTDPCPDTDATVNLSTVLASTYKEAIGVVCVFVIFVFLKGRQQYQSSRASQRKYEARRLKNFGEFKCVPA